MNAEAAGPGAEKSDPEIARSLVGRNLDFWLIGGASLLVWAVMFAAEGLRGHVWAVDHHFKNMGPMFASLSLLVNYPHFMASYRLAYTQKSAFYRRYWFQLWLVPILLVSLMTFSFFSMLDPGSEALIGMANGVFEKVGLGFRFSATGPLGGEVLTLLIHFMYFTVGWHYTKQTYGCMMVYANFDGYKLAPKARTTLKWSVFSIWWLHFAFYAMGTGPKVFKGFTYKNLGFPDWGPPVFAVVLLVALAVMILQVFLPKYRDDGVLPSANMMVPLVAMVVWWVPVFHQYEFYFYIVPFFHSLQYLPFYAKVERGRMEAEKRPPARIPRGWMIAIMLVVIGFLAFEFLPNILDVQTNTLIPVMWFVTICAHLFINIHHYFLDNCLWRFDNQDVRNHLLA
jgi:hypothetical protein